MTSLYRHIFTSPSVRDIFMSESFQAGVLNMTVDGPFKVRLPCCAACCGLHVACFQHQESIGGHWPLHLRTLSAWP